MSWGRLLPVLAAGALLVGLASVAVLELGILTALAGAGLVGGVLWQMYRQVDRP